MPITTQNCRLFWKFHSLCKTSVCSNNWQLKSMPEPLLTVCGCKTGHITIIFCTSKISIYKGDLEKDLNCQAGCWQVLPGNAYHIVHVAPSKNLPAVVNWPVAWFHVAQKKPINMQIICNNHFKTTSYEMFHASIIKSWNELDYSGHGIKQDY